MHKKLDSVSTESPSYFSYLGEDVKQTSYPVPGSRHLVPGDTLDKKRRDSPQVTFETKLNWTGYPVPGSKHFTPGKTTNQSKVETRGQSPSIV